MKKFQINNTKLYRYCNENSHIPILKDAMEMSKNNVHILKTYSCYKILFDHLPIIMDIIDKNYIDIDNNLDHYLIFMRASEIGNYDIMTKILSTGLELDKKLTITEDLQMSIFDMALSSEKFDLEMLHFFLENGLNIKNYPNFCANVVFMDDMILLDYYLDNFATDNDRKKMIIIALGLLDKDNKYQKIDRIIKGINLEKIKIDSKFDKCSVDDIILLMNHGMQVDESLFKSACINNLELANYLIGYGFYPDSQMLINVIKKSKIKLLELFAKHQIDLSTIHKKNTYDHLINCLEQCGLDKMTLLNYMIDRFVN